MFLVTCMGVSEAGPGGLIWFRSNLMRNACMHILDKEA